MSSMTARERHCQVVGLIPDRAEEYLELHRRIWPEIEQRIRASHIENYSIFRHGDLLVAYFEYAGIDFAGDMAAMADDPATQRWWKLTDPCQHSLHGATAGRLWTDASEIWRLSDEIEAS